MVLVVCGTARQGKEIRRSIGRATLLLPPLPLVSLVDVDVVIEEGQRIGVGFNVAREYYTVSGLPIVIEFRLINSLRGRTVLYCTVQS